MARAAGAPEGEEGLAAELIGVGAAGEAVPHALAPRPGAALLPGPMPVLPHLICHRLFLLLLLCPIQAEDTREVAQPWNEPWSAAAGVAPAV